MNSALRTLLGAASIATLAACSSSDDNSARVSELESDLAAANAAVENANAALSDHRAETAAAMHYHGLAGDRYISGRVHEEARADDGSTLTIEFSGPEASRADIVLDRAEDTPPPAGEAQGERFAGTGTPRPGVSAETVAVLYRTPLGTDSVLQYGWWQARGEQQRRKNVDRKLRAIRFGKSPQTSSRLSSDIAGMSGQAVFEGPCGRHLRDFESGRRTKRERGVHRRCHR